MAFATRSDPSGTAEGGPVPLPPAGPLGPRGEELTPPVYLDNHATTRLDPRVLEEMLPYLTDKFGNAGSSSHAYGWVAAGAVDVARERLAGLLGAAPDFWVARRATHLDVALVVLVSPSLRFRR